MDCSIRIFEVSEMHLFLLLLVSTKFCNTVSSSPLYSWKMEIMHFDENFNINPGLLSSLNKPISSNNEIDIASIPQEKANEASQLNHFATPHIGKVEIVDENGVVSNTIMTSLVTSGHAPVANLMYPSPIGNELDSEKSLLKINAMIYETEDDPTTVCLVYPIPIDAEMRTVYFFLPTVSFGPVILHSIEKSLHIVNHFHDSKSSKNVTILELEKPSWIVSMSANAFLMATSPSTNKILVSTDEFETFYEQEIDTSHLTGNKCPDSSNIVFPIGKHILFTSKAGSVLLSVSSTGKWNAPINSVIFLDDTVDVCLRRFTSSPLSYSQNILVVSSKRDIFTQIGKIEDSKLSLKMLVDSDGVSACEAASLSENSCIVIDHAFDPTSCCTVYVLLQSFSDMKYVLLEYKGLLSEGRWVVLTTISNILPTVKKGPGMVFLDETEQSSGKNLEIVGVTTLSRPDGSLYLWGSDLLVYDIRSGVVAWMHSFPAQGNAIQFAYANKKDVFSILTKSGAVLIGSPHPFTKHLYYLMQKIANKNEKQYLSVFYDSSDLLYGVTRTHVAGDDYTLKKEKISIKEADDKQCKRLYSCPRLFLECDAISSAFHINHTTYSRTRHFQVEPPRLMPRVVKSSFIHPLHNKSSLLMYLTVMQKFFHGQKISQPMWWTDENFYQKTRGNTLNDWWYISNIALKQRLKYLATANFLPMNAMMYLHEGQYLHETVHPPDRQEFWDVKFCSLPSVIYLDINQEFRFNVSIEHALFSKILNFDDLRLVTVASDSEAVDITVIRHQLPLGIIYEVFLTGQAMSHHPPGKHLATVSTKFYPWNFPKSNTKCCTTVSDGTAYEQNLLVKVGCPPARRLKFDSQRSLDILFSRGRTDDFECLYDSNNTVPCFTTSEFAAAFYVEDLVTGERSSFEGNYTLQIVGGGTGYLDNVKKYDVEQVQSYNYRPGDSKSLLSLIWSVLLESSSEGMRDNKTGRLIFDAKNPASIVFECRLDSPCGNIPLGTSNPGEFYLQIEVSNKGVDSSTNCDYTMQFMIHLIGIELSPRVHLMLMLITLTLLIICAVMYYLCKFAGGYAMVRKEELAYESDSDEEFAEPPPHFREVLNRRLTLGNMANPTMHTPGPRRPSLLAQSLFANTEDHGRKRSSVRVHGALNTKSTTSRVSSRSSDAVSSTVDWWG